MLYAGYKKSVIATQKYNSVVAPLYHFCLKRFSGPKNNPNRKLRIIYEPTSNFRVYIMT